MIVSSDLNCMHFSSVVSLKSEKTRANRIYFKFINLSSIASLYKYDRDDEIASKNVSVSNTVEFVIDVIVDNVLVVGCLLGGNASGGRPYCVRLSEPKSSVSTRNTG